jgi:hypothetical protein
MKKSGLADSPFFSKSAVADQPIVQNGEQNTPQLVPIFQNPIISEHLSNRSNEHLNENENVQMNERSKALSPERPIARKSYDVYIDQDVDIERLRIVMSQKRRTFVSKGMVIQTALDIGLEKLKKRYPLDTPPQSKI